MVIVGLDYGYAGQMTLEEITGCSPYGATTIAGSRWLASTDREGELGGARYQGRKIAETANKAARLSIAAQLRSRRQTMNEIVTEHSEGVLRIELNRPSKRNAMTASMYVTLADVFIDAARDERTRVALWHGAGDSFCAGNDIEDFLNNPPGPRDPPHVRLMKCAGRFRQADRRRRPRRGHRRGTTMLTLCDFVYAGESTKFRMPFIDLSRWRRNLDRASWFRRGSGTSGPQS